MAEKTNNLVALAGFGQSFWLDYIRRSFVEGGELAHMVADDGLRGLTSNPSIFEKAAAAPTTAPSWSRSPRSRESTPSRRSSAWRSATSATPPIFCASSTIPATPLMAT